MQNNTFDQIASANTVSMDAGLSQFAFAKGLLHLVQEGFQQVRFKSLSNASAAVMNRSSSRGVPIYAPAVPKSTYPLRRLRPTFPTMPLLNGDEGSQNALAIASRNA